uniref:Uncharacterized protein n=1 Tax=Rhizophora mucronata TaxID=61149 RepID=A0A2P2Q3I3_RHIMU
MAVHATTSRSCSKSKIRLAGLISPSLTYPSSRAVKAITSRSEILVCSTII